jgi:hypothetical protein
MSSRIRSCVECPKCHTRYLIGCSPYHNGSYIVAYPPAAADLLRLYCTCGDLLTSHTFKFSELKMYAVSEWAEKRGYGSAEEIVSARTATQKAS